MADNKKQSLEGALKQIENQFGKGTIMKLGTRETVEVPSIPTGSFGLDNALGIGGRPKGRVVENSGPESSGKTTLTLQISAECQKAGGSAAFIDAEHALDPEYAKALGVDIDELLLSQPDTGEQALEVTDMLVKSGSLDVIVVDSVAALVPRAELEEIQDSHVGLQARLMSQALERLGSIQNLIRVIFINQIRMKIGVMFGSPETTGKCVKFYSSVRLDKIGAIKGDEIIGNETRVKVVKNKVALLLRLWNFKFYMKSIRMAEIIEFAERKELLKSRFLVCYKGDKIGQGINNASTFLAENKKILEEIEGTLTES